MRPQTLVRSDPRRPANRWRGLPQRLIGVVTGAAFVIALLLTLVLGAVRFAFSWQPVYTYSVENYHADQVSGIPQPELLRATHIIRNYFTDNRPDLNISVRNDGGQLVPLFNAREIAHMRDVKALVHRVYLLLDLAIAYLIIYGVITLWLLHRSGRAFAREILRAATLIGLLIIAFGVASLFDFEQLFTEFHVLSFSNDFWQLDPAVDHLVQIFPQGFWLDVTLFVGLLALSGALVLATLARFYLFARTHPPQAEGLRTR